jgi:hypothetical protein
VPRHLLLILLFLAQAGCRCVPALPPPPAQAPPVAPVARAAAVLRQVRGAVTAFHGGASGPAAEGRELFPGDAVETGEAASALLRFASGRLVELGPEGRFELDEQGNGAQLTVARGLVLTRRAAPGAEGLILTISTPFGLTRMGDAQAQVAVHATGAEIEVLVGELELVPRTGDARRVGAGASGTLGAPRELPTIHLLLVGGGGLAEVRPAGARGWTALTAARRPQLEVGDRVRVQRGQVTLAPQGSPTRLELLAGAEVALLPSARGAGQESTGLEVARGPLEVATPGGQRTRVALGGGVILQAEEAGRFAVRRQGGLTEVRSRTGDGRLSWDGHPDVALPAGSSASLGPAGATVSAGPRDALQLPSRPGLEVFHGGVARVTLTWPQDPGPEGAEVVVASTPSLEAPLLQGRVREAFVSVPAPASGMLYWRVSSQGEEVASGSARFAPERTGRDLRRQRHQVPDGPETTSIYYQDKPPSVTFTWAAFPAAARYQVAVYREGDLSTPVAARATAEAALAVPEGTLGEGRYRWSVTPLDAAGVALQGGRLNRLELVYDNAVSQLVIRSPQEGSAAGPLVPVAGVAPLGSAVFANGRPLALDPQARFDEQVAPLPGGLVVFRVVQRGAEAFTVRTVRR